MASTDNDEALARELQKQEDELSPAPIRSTPVNTTSSSSWGDWFSAAASVAQVAADASLQAASVAKQQASLIAAQAQATYDRVEHSRVGAPT